MVTAVSLWAERAKTSQAQARQLIEGVRLLQLSKTFFNTILPALEWMHELDVLIAGEQLRVAAYAQTSSNVACTRHFQMNGNVTSHVLIQMVQMQ